MNGLWLPDAQATHALGRQLGLHAAAGDVLALDGPLGAGKTCLAQGVAVGLGVPSDHYVNSPTFTIVQIHPGRVPLYHIDLYRISDPDEAWGIGLEEYLGTDGVAVIEWPTRLPHVLPSDSLWLELIPDNDGRRARLTPLGASAKRLAEAVVFEPG